MASIGSEQQTIQQLQ